MWVCKLASNVFLLLVIASCHTVHGQIADQLGRIVKDSTLYFITVGNPSKTHLIARQFSIRDSLSTHVGLVIREDGKVKVYHVTDVNPTKSALRVESLDEFFLVARYQYTSLWRVVLSDDDFTRVLEQLESISSHEVSFDYDFDLANGNSLYCSEFCAGILNRADVDGLHFGPEQKELSEFYRKVLGRDVLTYFPVDFFQSSFRILKLAEYHN